MCLWPWYKHIFFRQGVLICEVIWYIWFFLALTTINNSSQQPPGDKDKVRGNQSCSTLQDLLKGKLIKRVFGGLCSVAIFCYMIHMASLYVEKYLPKDNRTEIIYKELQQFDLTDIKFCLRGTFSLLSCAIIAHYFFIVTPETKEKCALLWILRIVICRSDFRLLVRIVM